MNDSQYMDDIKNAISNAITDFNEADSLHAEKPLYEIGLDSLATVGLLVELSVLADVDLDDFVDDMEPPQTVGDLCSVMALFKETATCN